jgi:hypothetical protein
MVFPWDSLTIACLDAAAAKRFALSVLPPSERLPMPVLPLPGSSSFPHMPAAVRFRAAGLLEPLPALAAPGDEGVAVIVASADPEEDDEEDVGDEEDLSVAQPAADEDSAFDDFDDEFDDDFEEEENDPDWDHPDDGDNEPPPAGKGAGKKK